MDASATGSRFRPIIRVFVSSTFSDLVHERNELQDRAWPELEQFCQRQGFQFQAIDLRWGIPTEAGLDHRTMRICMEELQRAQEISPRPNFLILLGDRYGWQPLPEEISQSEFNRLASAASATDDKQKPLIAGTDGRTALQVLADWYQLDKNVCVSKANDHDPDREPLNYVLQPRTQDLTNDRNYMRTTDQTPKDTPEWVAVQEVLWNIINAVFVRTDPKGNTTAFQERFRDIDWAQHFADVNDDEILKRAVPQCVRFQGSATEQEIWRGALSIPHAADHVVAFARGIDNLDAWTGRPGLRDFVNVDESGAYDKLLHGALQALKGRLADVLGSNYLSPPNFVSLESILDGQGRVSLQIAADSQQATLDSLCSDILKVLKPIIQRQIDEYNSPACMDVNAPHSAGTMLELQREQQEHARFADERAPLGAFMGRDAAKQLIMEYLSSDNNRPFVVCGVSGSGKTALLAHAARESARSGQLLIQRFLGITKRSSDLRSLLTDLCQSLREAFQLAHEFPGAVRELEKEWYEQLGHATANRPIMIFVDALDQLDATDQSHVLWWIRSTPLPAHVKLVVSCLWDPDEKSATCPYAVMKQRGFLTASNSITLESLTPDEASQLWKCWFDRASRTLSEPQQQAIDRRILPSEARACRQPLYLKILFEEARRWHSYDSPPGRIGDTVHSLLQSLFDRLSLPAAHGPLVKPALSYLVSARYGLTEAELLEILFVDPDYRRHLNETAQHALPTNARRIPVAIWSRLRHELPLFLTERSVAGTLVLSYYHRSVAECVKRHFLKTPESQQHWHQLLEIYFSSFASATRHSLAERPFQLYHAGRRQDLARLLCDLDYLCDRCCLDNIHSLVADFDLLSPEYMHAVGQWPLFLARHTDTLAQFPDALFTLVHHEGFESARQQAEKLAKIGWKRSWIRTKSTVRDSSIPAADRPGDDDAHNAEVLTQHKHGFAVAGAIAAQSKLAIVAGRTGPMRMIDLSRGQSHDLPLEESASCILALRITSDASHLAIAGEDGRIRLRHLSTPESGFHSLAPHGDDDIRYLVPEFEAPALSFFENELIYQSSDGRICARHVAHEFTVPRQLVSSSHAPVGAELSGIAKSSDGVCLTFRVAGTTACILTVNQTGETLTLNGPFPDVAAICSLSRTGFAIVFCDHTLAFVTRSDSALLITPQLQLADLPLSMISAGDELFWLNRSGRLLRWRFGETIPSEFSGLPAIINAFDLNETESRTLAFVTSATAGLLRIGGTPHVVAPEVKAIFVSSRPDVLMTVRNSHGTLELNIDGDCRSICRAPPANSTLIVARDGRGMILIADSESQNLLLLDPEREQRQEVLIPETGSSLPVTITSVAGRTAGGFLLTDRSGVIYALDAASHLCRIASVELASVGRSSLLAQEDLAIWCGTCISAENEGHAHAVVFYRQEIGSTRLAETGRRVFASNLGRLTAVMWDQSQKRLLAFWQMGSGSALTVSAGTVTEYVDGQEVHVSVAGLGTEIIFACPSRDVPGLDVVTKHGQLYHLHPVTLQVTSVLALSEKVVRLSGWYGDAFEPGDVSAALALQNDSVYWYEHRDG